jgi:hypothetical protein
MVIISTGFILNIFFGSKIDKYFLKYFSRITTVK